MWELITMGNQWTRYSNHILNLITINTNDDGNNNNNVFYYSNVYPFPLSDGNIMPIENTGYVYCLVSTRNKDQINIVETHCFSQGLIRNNSGRGSQSMQDIINRPWDVASYIFGSSHMN